MMSAIIAWRRVTLNCSRFRHHYRYLYADDDSRGVVDRPFVRQEIPGDRRKKRPRSLPPEPYDPYTDWRSSYACRDEPVDAGSAASPALSNSLCKRVDGCSR